MYHRMENVMAAASNTYADTAFTNGYEFSAGTGYVLPRYAFTTPPEIARGETGRYPVVIVGAGISGLTLACALAEKGVPAILFDEDDTVGVKGAASRGICYAQKTLEIFKRLGVYQRIAGRGIQWSIGRTFAGDDEVYAFDLRQQQSHSLSMEPPFINIQQFYIEVFLVERIQELGHIYLRWRNRLVDFSQDADGATLAVSTPAGDYRLRADHVIDCTGSRSPFRTWCAASVTARKGDDRWCIADVRFRDSPPVERHTWIEAPFNENRAVWQHLMADGVWRIDYQMAPDADPEQVSREDAVRARLNAQFGRELAPDEFEIVWIGPYAYRSECLDQLRHGRVFFVGDAAHVVSPFGARGGNSGVQDADNLAWKLAAVLQGRAAPTLLESYHEERHQAAQDNVRVTNRTARFLRPADGVERLFRSAALDLARKHPFARQLVNTGRMSVPNVYTRSSACEPGGGQSVANVRLRWADGSAGEFIDLLQWAAGRLLLLVFGDLTPAAAQRLRQLAAASDLRCVQVIASGARAAAREHVIDFNGHLQAACHVFGHAWALVRPDSYLAATGEAVDTSVLRALEKSLGAQGTHD
ncbi:MAG: FAD-dependent monooxygenase [Burkholderiaceae bacterium]|nr:FAD-dependent monooxygenase [Burkholderiaceae bacterium]